MPSKNKFITLTIADEGTTTAAVDLRGWAARGIHMPADWDAADITFTASPTETGTYQTVKYSDGSATAIATATITTAAADVYIPFVGNLAVAMVSPGWVKVVASAAQTNGPRTLYLEVIEA